MYLRARSAAKLLDLPPSTFYQMVREGRLPPAASKVGRHQLWRQADLIAAVDPRGYKAAHDKAEAAAGRSPAGAAERPYKVLLAPRPGFGSARTKSAVAGRSPYAGILGGTGCRAVNPGGCWIDEFPDDGGPHG